MPYGVLPYISGVSSIPGQEDLVNSLIAQLEGPQITPPPTAPGKGPLWARILGPIGDALVAGGTIRRGGTPAAMGPYQSAVVRRGQDYRDALATYQEQTGKRQESQADLRNRVRIGQFEREQNLLGQEDIARIKNEGKASATKPGKSEYTINVDGVPHRFRQLFDPSTGQIVPQYDPDKEQMVDALDLGEAGYAPFVQPAIPGVSAPVVIGKKLGPGGAARTVGNVPPPPPSIVNSLAQDKASLQALDSLKAAYDKIRQETQGQNLAEKYVKTTVGGSRLGGGFESTRPYAEYKSSVRNSLNAYIKAQTGAQFSVAEMARYEAQYPEPWDPEDLAATKIENLSQRALADMQEKLRNYPGAAERPQTNPVDDILNEYDRAHPKP